MSFKEILRYHLDLKLNEKSKSLGFGEFCLLIQKDFVKQTVKNLLTNMKIRIRCEIFLTIYLMTYYQKHLFDESSFDKKIKNLAKDIIDILNNNCEKKILSKKVVEFNKEFNRWKKTDIKKQVEYFVKSHFQLEIIKNSCKEHIYIKSIEKIQNKLKKYIFQLIGQEKGLDHLKNYKTNAENMEKTLLENIKINLKKAFWVKLKNDLEKNPPILTSIPEILKDINTSLKILVPNNKKFRKEIDENIDYEFLKGQIDNGVFEYGQIFSLSNYIIDKIKELGMAENNDKIKKIKNWINNVQNKPGEFKLAEFLPKIFEEIMTKIEEIQRRIFEICHQ